MKESVFRNIESALKEFQGHKLKEPTSLFNVGVIVPIKRYHSFVRYLSESYVGYHSTRIDDDSFIVRFRLDDKELSLVHLKEDSPQSKPKPQTVLSLF